MQFTGAGYKDWRTKMEFGLSQKRLISTVQAWRGKPRFVRPTPITLMAQGELSLIPAADRPAARDARDESIIARDLEIEKWEEQDMDAQSFLIQHIGVKQLSHVRNCLTANEMWESLSAYFQLKGDVEIANANALLSAIVMHESEDLSVYVQRLQELHDLLESLGEPLNETKKASNLLNSLNTKYFAMIEIIQTWSATAPHLYNIQTILSTLLQRDVRIQINARKRGESSAPTSVPSANYGGTPAHRPQSGRPAPQPGACHKCGQKGHQARFCTVDLNCSHCKMTGHQVDRCWQLHGKPDFKKTSSGKPSAGRDGKKCDHCGKIGHIESECNAKKAEMRNKAYRAANCSNDEFDASKASSYTASCLPPAAACLSANVKCPLILDSGATDHIFPSIEFFSEYTTSVPLERRFIYTADDKPHEVQGQGTVTLLLHNGAESLTVRLQALHVPSLGQTLVSLGCINKRGKVAFQLSKDGTPTLTQHDRPWADVKATRNGLLLLSGHIVLPGMEGCDVAPHGQALSVGCNWHLRLGHPGLTVMETMIAQGMIPSLTKEERSKVANCEICCAAKMAQGSHKAHTVETATCQKLDRIHLDLVGPMRTVSKHGQFMYFQSGIDVGTRMSFVSLLKSKGEAFNASKPLITALEVESRTNLKSLRTDGGGEYISNEWKAFAKDKGFQHQLIAPYSPEQNGVNERLNRTLLEKMRCLLLWSELPKSYWDVALLHANRLRNRTPTSGLNGGVPLTAWTGKQTDLKSLHTFGCLVQYLKIGHDKPTAGKLAPKTAYGIFLGLPKDQAGFLIWDPTRPEIMVRTDVKFYEDQPGFPRLRQKASPKVPLDDDFFTLFPMGGAPSAVPPTPSPAASTQAAIQPSFPLLPAPPPPIDVIQLSSDIESGVHGGDEDGESEVQREESISDRVAARRRAQFASFGDVL